MWVEHPEWSFICNNTDESPPHCDVSAPSFRMSHLRLSPPLPPPSPPPSFEQGLLNGKLIGRGEGFTDGLLVGIAGASAFLGALVFVLRRMVFGGHFVKAVGGGKGDAEENLPMAKEMHSNEETCGGGGARHPSHYASSLD